MLSQVLDSIPGSQGVKIDLAQGRRNICCAPKIDIWFWVSLVEFGEWTRLVLSVLTTFACALILGFTRAAGISQLCNILMVPNHDGLYLIDLQLEDEK